MANLTRLRSLKGKEKDVSKKINIYIAPWRPKTQRYWEDKRAKPSKTKARYSRPTCKNCSYLYIHTFILEHYNSTQYCKTETVFFIFPFLQTNITSQMCPLKMLKLDSLQLQHFRSHKKNQNRCHHADTFHRRSPAQNIRYLNKFGAVALSLTSLHGELIALPILPSCI